LNSRGSCFSEFHVEFVDPFGIVARRIASLDHSGQRHDVPDICSALRNKLDVVRCGTDRLPHQSGRSQRAGDDQADRQVRAEPDRHRSSALPRRDSPGVSRFPAIDGVQEDEQGRHANLFREFYDDVLQGNTEKANAREFIQVSE